MKKTIIDFVKDHVLWEKEEDGNFILHCLWFNFDKDKYSKEGYLEEDLETKTIRIEDEEGEEIFDSLDKAKAKAISDLSSRFVSRRKLYDKYFGIK